MVNLLATTSRVETPFIIADIGGYTFGGYTKSTREYLENNNMFRALGIQYPKYMQSLTVEKVNGTVNNYTLTMKYPITQHDDPNLIEKVLSKVSNTRLIKLSYGDLSTPNYIYKEEECLITKVTSSIDINSSSITYNISCVSQSVSLTAGTFSPEKRVAKPSDVIKEILYNNICGILDIFNGMRDKELVLSKGLIASDDQVVTIEAQRHINIFDYIKYLIKCMRSIDDANNSIQKSDAYTLVVQDDTKGIFSGPYFKVIKITDKVENINDLDTYEVDIGYPSTNIVVNFSVEDNQAYSILYNYSESINQSKYIYRINDDGKIDYQYSPQISNSRDLMKTTESDRTWWSNVTKYPINATLTIKGLLKPVILMSYIKLNVLFYGQKHISSGYYVITKQTDTISTEGYRTTLKLMRIGGDN